MNYIEAFEFYVSYNLTSDLAGTLIWQYVMMMK